MVSRACHGHGVDAHSSVGDDDLIQAARPSRAASRWSLRTSGTRGTRRARGTSSASRALRPAIRKVSDGEYGDAVVAARRAIDDMGTGWASEKSVVGTARDKRSLDQRLSLLRHALFSLASPPAHGDPVAASIKWDRENAMTVIAGVAALAACRPPSPQP